VISPLQAPTWRLAHPAVFWLVCAAALGLAALWWPGGVALLLGVLASLGAERWYRHRALRTGHPARWVIPTSRRWWSRRLTALGVPALPSGRVWEMHVADGVRWAGAPPAAAAARFRQAYAADMRDWITARPPGVALVCSTFNRLTPEEVALIGAAGGTVASGAIHPRLPATMTPRAYRRLQRRMFGGVVSPTIRTDSARWTTWVVPPRPAPP
jgi:hypothetical protein